jgi:hypothetical protein
MRIISDDTKLPRRKKRRNEDSNMEPQSEREQREWNLSAAAANMQNRFIDPQLAKEGLVDPTLMTEADPQAASFIEEELFPSVGFNPEGGQNASKYAWSAATVSDLASAFDPSFQKSARHSDYIRRGFQGEGNYESDKISKRTDFKPGDILFKGRVDGQGNPLGPQTYKQFKKDAKGKGEFGQEEGYGSHSDIIVGSGTDSRGKYYEVQGGNVGDKLSVKRLYANELAKKYAGRLTQ